MNEELRSAAEELESSKEELQSVNEELTTVNEELQNRMAELSQTNDDLHNVLVGIDNTVLIVGMDLRIRRYTTSAERLLNLVPADLGRSIGFLDGFCATDMRAKVSQVIETLATFEEEALCGNQHWYQIRIAPYKTLDHAIRGAVVSLADIDARKRSAALSRDVGDYATKFLGAIHHPLLMVDGKFRIVWANEAYYRRFQVVPQETIGNVFPSPGETLWNARRLREHLEQTLRTGEILRDFTIQEDEGKKVMRVGASRVPVASDSLLLLISLEEE